MSSCVKRFLQRCFCRKQKNDSDSLPTTISDKDKKISSSFSAPVSSNLTSASATNALKSVPAPPKSSPPASNSSTDDNDWEDQSEWGNDFQVTIDSSAPTTTVSNPKPSSPSFSSISRPRPSAVAPPLAAFPTVSQPTLASSSPVSTQPPPSPSAGPVLAPPAPSAFSGMTLSNPRLATLRPVRPLSSNKTNTTNSQAPEEPQPEVDYFQQMDLARTQVQAKKVAPKPPAFSSASITSASTLAMKLDDDVSSLDSSTWGDIDVNLPAERKGKTSQARQATQKPETKAKKPILSATAVESSSIDVDIDFR